MAERHAADPGALVLRYPVVGRLRVRNSPATRVPSHGTDLMGTTYAIDLVPVDDRGRSARFRWRAALATERPDDFVGFGAQVLAPCSGTVVVAHDGEDDHVARRSPPALLLYALGQARRLRGGVPAIAGNHVVIAVGDDGPFMLIAHLRRGSVGVRVGDHVRAGEPVARCGNSGNSTEPHVHLQATDSLDWPRSRGLPIAFAGPGGPELPHDAEIVVVPGGVGPARPEGGPLGGR